MAGLTLFDLVLPFGHLQMVDEAVNLERANWVEECGRINAAYVILLFLLLTSCFSFHPITARVTRPQILRGAGAAG